MLTLLEFSGFKIHYPERGRKRLRHRTRCTLRVCWSSKSITPKGDGNVPPTRCSSTTKQACSKSITPKGDGNRNSVLQATQEVGFKIHYPERGRKHVIQHCIHLRVNGSKSITPKGDGNEQHCLIVCRRSFVQNPLPRKGTET